MGGVEQLPDALRRTLGPAASVMELLDLDLTSFAKHTGLSLQEAAETRLKMLAGLLTHGPLRSIRGAEPHRQPGEGSSERWRQIVNAWSECYPTIIAEVTENPDRADQRAREVIRYANGYGFTVTNQEVDQLAAETVKQLQARKAKKENPSQDPTQKRVMKGADPVMLFNGQFVHDATDLRIDGAGMDFEFIRTYRNQAGYEGPLGFNWDHNYNLWLRVSGENIFRSTGGLGTESFVRHRRFGEPGFTYWAPPDGTCAVLLEEGDSFVCRYPNG